MTKSETYPLSTLLQSQQVLRPPSVSVIGLDDRGLADMACFCDLGLRVIGVDADSQVVDCINQGEPPVANAGMNALLTWARTGRSLSATTELAGAVCDTSVTVVSVSDHDASPSLALEKLTHLGNELGYALRHKGDYHLLVVHGQVPRDSMRHILVPLLEKISGKQCGVDFGLCVTPALQRRRPTIIDPCSPAITVVGAFDQHSAMLARALYGDLPGRTVTTSLESAESALVFGGE